MSNILNVLLQSGEVRFIRKVDAVPDHTETSREGGVEVNIHNVGSPEVPAHFQVSFHISVELEEQGLPIQNYVSWTEVVLSADGGAPYREIEAQAAQQIAPMLRAVANQIEESVAEFDQRGQSDA